MYHYSSVKMGISGHSKISNHSENFGIVTRRANFDFSTFRNIPPSPIFHISRNLEFLKFGIPENLPSPKISPSLSFRNATFSKSPNEAFPFFNISKYYHLLKYPFPFS